MKKYNILNNSIGWACFVIATITYMLTLEPTASFWDCPEFIIQGFKLEVGHPPGNPIFMLTARFFANFAFGDITKVALMVNAMSALLSAGTILLLFWTITHLVRRLTVKDDATEVSPLKMLIIFTSGICGALMYAWSDTFWFSAVEAEVYAFSSFCTALVFWLILKWESRADNPHSDKYLIFIAYIIGISIAVHLLNLLCIPAIVLVIYYRKWANPTLGGSCIALLISFVVVGLILYGLVPGFIAVAQRFEYFCVNTLGMPFNAGVILYALILIACFAWTIFNIYKNKSNTLIKCSFLLSTILSGVLFIGHGWLIPTILIIALSVYLIIAKELPIRILSLTALSFLVIFVGYSSYALLLIRSSANTPMNQNDPDNVFALSSYLNREQYGDRPLIYGETPNSEAVYKLKSDGNYEVVILDKPTDYAKSPSGENRYESYEPQNKRKYKMTPELNMLFPRIYSSSPLHKRDYASWIGKNLDTFGKDVYGTVVEDHPKELMNKPTMGESLSFLFVYQLNHMYWRYFMWNFSGRQNDIQGNGEPTHGNWISGIPFIDNPRLGDQSLLPDDLGKNNKGHNVFFMLPLILGLIGLTWQACCSQRGIEQFWVVFFLFFMTGIAIVLYLNQTPNQPRERDYAFAGSFYAYAIWVGMGVAGLWRMFLKAQQKKGAKDLPENQADFEPERGSKAYKTSLTAAIIAAIVGVIVPIQVVSQTWDDHDRSGRYTARDFGMNYLNSLDENAIIFTYGDNDTFPLWYAQEVEGVRTDVKVVNLSYLNTDWYIDQIRRPSYESKGIDMLATSQDYVMDRLPYAVVNRKDTTTINITDALNAVYAKSSKGETASFPTSKAVIPVDAAKVVESGRISDSEIDLVEDIKVNLSRNGSGYATLNNIIGLDILSSSIANGWNRPVYFAITVPSENYMGLSPYFCQTGLAYEVVPTTQGSLVNTDKMYRNVTEHFRWGGLDKAQPGELYLDETVRRMTLSNRGILIDLVNGLIDEGLSLQDAIMSADENIDSTSIKQAEELVADRITKAKHVMQLFEEKIPASVMPLLVQEAYEIAKSYWAMAQLTGDDSYKQKSIDTVFNTLQNLAQYIRYYQSLRPSLYSILNGQDRNNEPFFVELLKMYNEFGGDIDKLNDEVIQPMNIDLSRYISAE